MYIQQAILKSGLERRKYKPYLFPCPPVPKCCNRYTTYTGSSVFLAKQEIFVRTCMVFVVKSYTYSSLLLSIQSQQVQESKHKRDSFQGTFRQQLLLNHAGCVFHRSKSVYFKDYYRKKIYMYTFPSLCCHLQKER